MNKIASLSALTLALALASCDNYQEPNPPAQSNPQESILQTDQVQVAPQITAQQNYDLNTLNDNRQNILLATIQCSTLPQGYTFTANVEATTTGETQYFKIPATVETTDPAGQYSIYITPDDLNGAYAQNITKNPSQATLDIRFNVLTQLGTQLAYVGGPSNYYTTDPLTFTPFTPDHTIEDAYYIVGNFCNWDLAQAIECTQLNPGEPYDNPVFTATVNITLDQATDGWQYKIIPQSTLAAGTTDNNTAYGSTTITPDKLNGSLADNNQPGTVTAPGHFTVEINMATLTVDFLYAFDTLTVPFGTQTTLTDTDFDTFYTLSTYDHITYTGFAQLDQQWFITALPYNDGVNYMAGGTQDLDPTTGVITGQLTKLTDYTQGTRITAPKNAIYQVNANIADLTYQCTPLNTISLVGEFNGWKETEGAQLTNTPAQVNVWTANNIHITPGGYKIVANDSWAINWGGSLDNLVNNGADLKIDTEGDYDFTLTFNPAGGFTTMTVTKK